MKICNASHTKHGRPWCDCPVDPSGYTGVYRDEIGKNRVDGCLEDSHPGVNMADPGVNTADPDVNTVPIRNTADPA